MAKPKTCPVDHNHITKEVTLGPSISYYYCEHCKEDVEYLARNAGKEWDDIANVWVDSLEEEEFEEYQDEYDDYNDEDEDDDFGTFNAGVNPPNWNPHPVRVMGQGRKQLVLNNDNHSAAHLVQKILMDVFGKDLMEADFIMKDAHYHGRAVAFYCQDDAEAQDYLQKIEDMKQDLIDSGCIGHDRVSTITFTVEDAPQNAQPNP